MVLYAYLLPLLWAFTCAARNCTADERLPFTRGPGMPGPYRAAMGKRNMAVSSGPGMPGPCRMRNFSAVFLAGCTAFSTNMNEICSCPLD